MSGPPPVRHVRRVGAGPKGVGRRCRAGPAASSRMTRGGPRGTGREGDDGGRQDKVGGFCLLDGGTQGGGVSGVVGIWVHASGAGWSRVVRWGWGPDRWWMIHGWVDVDTDYPLVWRPSRGRTSLLSLPLFLIAITDMLYFLIRCTT